MYVRVDCFTASKHGFDVTRANLEDPMHQIANTVEGKLRLMFDLGTKKLTPLRRRLEIKLNRFPELKPVDVDGYDYIYDHIYTVYLCGYDVCLGNFWILLPLGTPHLLGRSEYTTSLLSSSYPHVTFDNSQYICMCRFIMSSDEHEDAVPMLQHFGLQVLPLPPVCRRPRGILVLYLWCTAKTARSI